MVPGLPPENHARQPPGLVIEITRSAKVEWDRETAAMIEVTKLNGEIIMVNADHLELVEAHPDTTLVLANERRIVVKDTVAAVVKKVMEYQRKIRSGIVPTAAGEGTD